MLHLQLLTHLKTPLYQSEEEFSDMDRFRYLQNRNQDMKSQ